MTSNSTAQLLVVTERAMLKEAQTLYIHHFILNIQSVSYASTCACLPWTEQSCDVDMLLLYVSHLLA